MISEDDRPAEVYELRAKKDGNYICHSCPGGTIQLKKGELWKYGKTVTDNSMERYASTSYEAQNFDKSTIYEGLETGAKILEKTLIVSYPGHPENIERSEMQGIYIPRPPGNKIDK